MSREKTPDTPAVEPGVIDNLITGLKVLGGELKWMLTRVVRRYEIRQVQRRLDAEHANLGRIARSFLQGEIKGKLADDDDARMTMSQIEFIEQEIGRLDEDLDRTRQALLERRQRESSN